MDHVALQSRSGQLFLKEISGIEEQSVSGVATTDALSLLGSLTLDRPGGLQKKDLGDLTVWERDQLLATLYISIYGPKISNTLSCRFCKKVFDLDFFLPQLMQSLAPKSNEMSIMSVGSNKYALKDGLQFRLPTFEDECAVVAQDEDSAVKELLKRCTDHPEAGDFPADRAEEIQAAMESIAPIVDPELTAQCPECGGEQPIRFDLQHYLLQALHGERARLMEDIHSLASVYGWSLSDILSLPRSQRCSLARLADNGSVRVGRQSL